MHLDSIHVAGVGRSMALALTSAVPCTQRRTFDVQCTTETNTVDAFVNDIKDSHGKELERHLTEQEIRKERCSRDLSCSFA